MPEEIEQKIELKEVVKLMKMSKGYNWEIKVLGNPNITDKEKQHLKEINEWMINEYG